MKYFNDYETAIGPICLAEENGFITNLIFLNPENGDKKKADERTAKMVIGGVSEKKETALLRKAYEELLEYLGGKRKEFDLPLAPSGTAFQEAVWRALETIPYGETRSYKDIAVMAGNQKACRAVGMANNRNPIAIFIPCHRVIGASGKLVGYGGGLDVKEKLLALEVGK